MKLTDWTYRETLVAPSCEEAESLALSVARRNVPEATVEITEHRHTPTGRHSMKLHRTRPEGSTK